MLINNKNTIIILRTQDRAKCLETLLTSNGYNVIIEPVIKVIPYKYIPTDFKKADAIMLTSVNSVKILNNSYGKSGKLGSSTLFFEKYFIFNKNL